MESGVKVSRLELTADASSKVRANVEILIAGRYVAKGLSVVDGKNGAFVSMPRFKENGVYQDRFFPVTKEARAELNKLVLDEFEKKRAA